MKIDFEAAEDLTTGRFRIRSRAQAKVTGQSTATQVGRARALVEINGTRHPLQAPGLVVGRGTEADVRINDPGVSRRHVEFLVSPAPVATTASRCATSGRPTACRSTATASPAPASRDGSPSRSATPR